MSVYGQQVIMEFQGDPDKNKEFSEILKEVQDVCIMNISAIEKINGYILKVEESVGKLMTVAFSGKSSKKALDDMRQLSIDVKKYVEEFNNWSKEQYKGVNFDKSLNKLRRLSKTFNNKYSEVTMEEKKKLMATLNDYRNKALDLIKPWAKGGSKGDTLLNDIKRLKDIDSSYSVTIYNTTLSMMNFAVNEYNYCLADFMYIQRLLKIERENSLIYKIVNRILD